MTLRLSLKATMFFLAASSALWSSLHVIDQIPWMPQTSARELGRLDTGIPLPAGEVCSLAFSHDGALAAAGMRGGLVRVWETATRRPRVLWQAHVGFVNAMAFCPGSAEIVTTGADRTVKRWSLNDLQTPRWSQPCPEATLVTALAVSRDGRTLALGSDDRLGLWHAVSGVALTAQSLHATGARLRTLAFSSDGSTLAGGGGGDNAIRIWELSGSLPVQQIVIEEDAEHWVRGLAYLAEGSTLVSIETNGRLRAWDRDGRLLATAHAGPAPFMHAAIGLGQFLLVADGGEAPARVLRLPNRWWN